MKSTSTFLMMVCLLTFSMDRAILLGVPGLYLGRVIYKLDSLEMLSASGSHTLPEAITSPKIGDLFSHLTFIPPLFSQRVDVKKQLK